MKPFNSDQEFANYLGELKQKQFYKWTFLNPLEVIVPANDSRERVLDIKSGQHFQAVGLTVSYSTLVDDPQNPGTTIDDGVNRLAVQFEDDSNQLRLSSGPISLELLASPGRTLSDGITGTASNQLFIPLMFDHIFGAKGGITVNVSNSSDVENTAKFLWVGYNLLDQRIKAKNGNGFA